MQALLFSIVIILTFVGCSSDSSDQMQTATSFAAVSSESSMATTSRSSTAPAPLSSSMASHPTTSSTQSVHASFSSISYSSVSSHRSSIVSQTASSVSSNHTFFSSQSSKTLSVSISSERTLSSSSAAAHSSAPSSQSSIAGILSSSKSSYLTESSLFSSSSEHPAETGCDVTPLKSAKEERVMLVVRIQYDNALFRNGADLWAAKIFGEEEHQLNHYFLSVSQGKFQLQPAHETDGQNDGIITVTDTRNHPDSGSGNAIHPYLKDALTLADTSIDFSTYDIDGNEAITPDEMIIMFIVAGNEDAFSGANDKPGVWAHRFCTNDTHAPTLDGVTLMACSSGGSYAVFGERHSSDSLTLNDSAYDEDASIGIIAHELGHAAFNLPDLYDIFNQSAGIGYFGLMGSGMWGQQSLNESFGNTPVAMTAWSRLQVGWASPHVIVDTHAIEYDFYDSHSEAYNIALLPISDHECFLVENRSVNGYDAGLNRIQGLYRGGLAIWHVDQTVIDQTHTTNTVNANVERKGVDLEEANRAELDKTHDFPGHARNLFFSDNQKNFTETTSPDSARNNKEESGVRIIDISKTSSMMQAIITNPFTGEAQ